MREPLSLVEMFFVIFFAVIFSPIMLFIFIVGYICNLFK